jgi:phosphoribosylamine-glycine ligase
VRELFYAGGIVLTIMTLASTLEQARRNAKRESELAEMRASLKRIELRLDIGRSSTSSAPAITPTSSSLDYSELV